MVALFRLIVRLEGRHDLYSLGYVESMYPPYVGVLLQVPFHAYTLIGRVRQVEMVGHPYGATKKFEPPVVEVVLWEKVDIDHFLAYWDGLMKMREELERRRRQ